MRSFWALAFAVGLTAASAQEMYKWVDADGNVHYSDRPPETEQAVEEIAVDASISASRRAEGQARLEASRTALNDRRRAQLSQSQEQAQLQAEAANRQAARDELCAQARRNLGVLTRQGPAYSVNDAGERVYVDDNQRDAEIARYRSVIAQACNS